MWGSICDRRSSDASPTNGIEAATTAIAIRARVRARRRRSPVRVLEGIVRVDFLTASESHQGK